MKIKEYPISPMNVSIIVPSYNQGPHIRECIESLIRQPIKIEIFVFDSDSSDGTAEILKDYVGKIDFFIEKDLGQSHAINKGLEKARGDILGYLNSDDTLLSDSIGKVLDFWAEYPDTDLLYGKSHYIDEHSRVIGDYRTRIWDQAAFKGECFLCQPSCFWSRRIFNRIGFFDEHLDCSLDYDYWLRIARSGGVIKYLDEYLSCSRDYPETKTRKKHSYTNTRKKKLVKQHSEKLGKQLGKQLVKNIVNKTRKTTSGKKHRNKKLVKNIFKNIL